MGIYAGTAQNAAGMILRAGGIDTAVNGAASTYAQFFSFLCGSFHCQSLCRD